MFMTIVMQYSKRNLHKARWATKRPVRATPAFKKFQVTVQFTEFRYLHCEPITQYLRRKIGGISF